MKITISALAITMTIPAAAQAAGFADLSAIDMRVSQFLSREIGQASGAMPVDRRLKLSPCQSDLSLSWYGHSQESVLVQCPVPGGWRLFVPVKREAAEAAGLEKAVSRGDAVTIVVRGDNFKLSDRGTAMGSGFADDWIEVKPARKDGKVLQARVVRPGVVDVQLP